MTFPELEAYVADRVEEFYSIVDSLRRSPIPIPKGGCGSVLHEYIKASLFQLGRSMNLTPLPEFQPYPGRRGKRVDLVFVSPSHRIVAAFELDQGMSPRSVEKLEDLPRSCVKCLISLGAGSRKLTVSASALDAKGIRWINVTKSKLHIDPHRFPRKCDDPERKRRVNETRRRPVAAGPDTSDGVCSRISPVDRRPPGC